MVLLCSLLDGTRVRRPRATEERRKEGGRLTVGERIGIFSRHEPRMSSRNHKVSCRSPRLFYVDNLRLLLSSLVVLFHLSMTYGAVESWPYIETTPSFPGTYPLILFAATCQSFFMGMFFLISAHFTVGSIARKGTPRFLLDRLLRLGIPVTLYFFFLEPLNGYFARCWRPNHLSYLGILYSGWGRGIGAIWFLVALGLFTAVYAMVRPVLGRAKGKEDDEVLAVRDFHIVLFILFLTVVTFLIRVVYPVGEGIRWVGFSLGHFPQYIALFALGIWAARRGLQNPFGLRRGKRWGYLAAGMVLFGFPALLVAGGAASGNVSVFMGGAYWQSLAYSFWEQCTGIAIIVALLGFAREKLDHAGKIKGELGASAYAVYVFHAPIVVGISVFFRRLALPPLVKFLVISPVVLAASFLFACLIRRAPHVRRIL